MGGRRRRPAASVGSEHLAEAIRGVHDLLLLLLVVVLDPVNASVDDYDHEHEHVSAPRSGLPAGDELSRLVEDAIRTDLYREERAALYRMRKTHEDLSGVSKDSNGTYKFDLIDSFGRRTSRSGFRNEAEAKAAFETAQKRYLGLGLLEAFEKHISGGRKLDTVVEEYLKSELHQQSGLLEDVWNQLRSSYGEQTLSSAEEYPTLIDKAQVLRMTEQEHLETNRKIVQHASKLFVGEVDSETSHLAKVIAARLRQLNHAVSRSSRDPARPYAMAFNFVTQPNSTMRDFIDVVSEFQYRSAGLQSEAVFPLIAEVLKVDRLPVLESIKSPEQRDLALSVCDFSFSKPDFPLRIEEAIPNESSRSDTELFKEYERGFVASNKSAKSLLLRTRSNLSETLGPNLDAELRTMVEATSPFPIPGSTQVNATAVPREGVFSEFLISRSRDIVRLHDAVRKTEVGDKVLAPFAVWSDPLARKAAEKSSELRALVHEEIAPVLAAYREDTVGQKSTSSVKLSQVAPDAEDCIDDLLTLSVTSAKTSAPDGTTLASRPGPEANVNQVVDVLTNKLSFRARQDVFALIRTLAGGGKLSGHRISMTVEAMVNAMGDKASEVMPTLIKFFDLDPFWYVASVGHLNAKVEAIEAFVAPELVSMRESAKIKVPTVHRSLGLYDRENAIYIKEVDAVERPNRSGLAFDPYWDTQSMTTEQILHHHYEGLPEARGVEIEPSPRMLREAAAADGEFPTQTGYEWLGCDGLWYETYDDAIRTWYTPDIVGDFGEVADEARLILCLRRQHELAFDSAELLGLHRAVRPESGDNLERALLRIVRSVATPSERMALDRLLGKLWLESRIVLNPAGHCMTIGRSKPLHRLYAPFHAQFGEERCKLLYPCIMQNVLGVTPERVTAVNAILNPTHDFEDFDQDAAGKSNGWQPRTGVAMEAVSEGLSHREGPRRAIHLRDKRMRYLFDVEKIADVSSAQGVPLLERGSAISNESWATRTVFLNNIPPGFDEATLGEIMSSVYGPVERVAIHMEQSIPELPAHQRETKRTTTTSTLSSKSAPSWLNDMRDEAMPSLQTLSKTMTRAKDRLEHLESMASMYMRHAQDQAYWLEGNWNKADLVVSSMQSESQAREDDDPQVSLAAVNKMSRQDLAKVPSSELNAGLVYLSAECDDTLRALRELKKRLKLAERGVQRAWQQFESVSPKTKWPQSVGELAGPVPEQIGGQILDNYIGQREKFVEALTWANVLLRTLPDEHRALSEKMESVLDLVNETQRRRRVVEAALGGDRLFDLESSFALGEDEASAKMAGSEGSDTFVSRGRLQGLRGEHSLLQTPSSSTSSSTSDSAGGSWFGADDYEDGADVTAEDDDDAEDDDGDEELDGNSNSGSSSAGREPESAGRSSSGARAEGGSFIEAIPENEMAHLLNFTEWYNSVQDPDYATRMKQAQEIQRASKIGRNRGASPRDTLKKVYNEIVSRTGAYAFVTFADDDSYANAMSTSNRTFGITLSGPASRVQGTTQDFVQLEEGSIKKYKTVKCEVQPATEKANLYVRGMRNGLSAAEVANVLQGHLEPAFPGIRLNFGRDAKVLTDGSCVLRFFTFAESLAAYEALNGRAVLGSPLVVGWSVKQDPRGANRKRRKYWYTSRHPNPLDSFVRS
ncbi:RNA-binding protein 8A [Hondaea fermentalgiana]|uniref:RNA-binding protein 8A n=1 Tax=Hondaea fermentalgiana TaxID=2315210 RepID=A0A2R5GH84_9STRA|nr:RNA-binding protein 8A [Hondaea fermentalgiana]|eukprot:GBG27631.1 RNA-binding protein 8A [Hondaea fermentalgiana]